jgi:hypothetical protein
LVHPFGDLGEVRGRSPAGQRLVIDGSQRNVVPQSRPTFADDVIGGVRRENPWKEGTKGHGYYAKYRNGMTVAEAVKAGAPRGYIRWDVAHGFITLKKSEG